MVLQQVVKNDLAKLTIEISGPFAVKMIQELRLSFADKIGYLG